MNLNVIRTLTMRSKVEGADESRSALEGLVRSHGSVAAAVEKAGRQIDMAARAQNDFASASRSMISANDNLAKSWRDAEVAGMSFRQQAVGGTTRLGREIERLGLQGAVVTGMLHKTKEGFTILQNPANGAAGAVGKIASNLNIMTATADPASQAVSNFSKHLSLLGAAGAVTAVIIAIRKAMDDLFEVANRAQDTRLGSTELLALQAAATSARVPLTALNAAIDKFTEVSKKAPEDAKEFHKALSNIAPELSKAFQSAPTQAERLRIVAEGLATARNEVQRYQLATEAFGTDNDRLIAVFSGGRTALDGYIERARAFGIVVDDAFIAKSQEAQAQFNTLTTLIQQRLTVAVVEGTLAVSAYASSWADLSGGSLPSSLGAFGSIKAAIRDVSYDLGLLAQAWAAVMKPGPITRESINEILEPLKKIFLTGDIDRVFAVGGKEAWDSFIKAFEDAATTGSGRTVNAFDQALRNVPAPKPAFQPRPDLKETTNEFDRLEKSMRRAAAVQEAEAMAVDKSVGEHARLRAEMRLQEAAMQDIEKHGGKMDDYAERIKTLADRFGTAAQKAAELKLKSDIKFTGDTLFLSDTEQQIASILRHVHGSGWKDMMKSPEADAMRLNAALKEINDTLGSAASGFAKDMFNGVSAIEAAANAATKLRDILIDILAKKVMTSLVGSLAGGVGETAGATTSATILTTAGTTLAASMVAGATSAAGILTGAGAVAGTEVATGGFVGGAAMEVGGAVAGVEEAAGGVLGGAALATGGAAAAFAIYGPIALLLAAVAAAAAVLGGGSSRRREEEAANRRRNEETQSRSEGLQNRFNTASDRVNFDTSNRTGSLAAQEAVFQRERAEEAARGGILMANLLSAQGMERLALQREWDEKELERKRDYQERLFDATGANDSLQGQIAEANRRFIRERLEETKAGGVLMNELVRTQEAELQAIIDRAREEAERAAEEAAREAERLAKEIRGRRESFQDRQFAATNDPNTLAGQLAAFDREAMRDRRDELEAGGQAINDLIRAQELERLNIIKDFNEQALAETKRAEKERQDALTQAARGIVDYLLGLKAGSDSPLSPSARLAAARQAYDATLGLAQGGNMEALNRITKDAEAFRTAGQAMFGSSAGYQAIFNQIQEQLRDLPPVTGSTDPVVSKLAEVLGAVQATTTAVGGTTTAVGGTTAAVGGTTTAVGVTTSEVTRSIGIESQMVGLLTALNALNTTMSTLLTNIKDFNANMSVGMDNIRVHTLNTSISTNESVNKLNWIAQNAQRIVNNTRFVATQVKEDPPGFFTVTKDAALPSAQVAVAMGGMVPPFTNFMAAEHSPQGPIFGRTGSQPFAVTPNMPSNDNGEVVLELRALRREHAMTQTQIARLTAQVAVAVSEGFSTQNRVIKDTERDGAAGARARRRGRAAA